MCFHRVEDTGFCLHCVENTGGKTHQGFVLMRKHTSPLGVVPPLADKLCQYESSLANMRQHCRFGLPDVATNEWHELHNMIFGRGDLNSSSSPEQAARCDAAGVSSRALRGPLGPGPVVPSTLVLREQPCVPRIRRVHTMLHGAIYIDNIYNILHKICDVSYYI